MNNISVRTLFITRDLPYPPMGGAALRNWQNINTMMKYGSVGIFSVFKGTPESKTLPGIALWHHYDLNQPLSQWEKLQKQLWWLRRQGHPEVDRWYAIAAIKKLEAVITQFKPDIVVFEEIWLYPYLKTVKRHKCRIIFDNHNVEAELLQQRYRAMKARRAQIKEKIEVPKIKSIERDFIRQADQVWLCSESDTHLLQKWYGQISHSQVISNGINLAYYDNVRLGEIHCDPDLKDGKKNLIFVGSFTYIPNIEAAKLLINQIYPKLKKLYPDCRLLIVGKNPPQKIREVAQTYSDIILTGKVPDVRPYLAAASVVVTPLFQGSGTRLKILEAFAASRPVVSTSKGVEGLKVKDGEHILIRDNVDDLVAGVSQLWSEPILQQKLADSAYKLVKQEYSWEAVSIQLDRAIRALLT